MLAIKGIPGTFINAQTRRVRFVEDGEFWTGDVLAKKYTAKVFDGVLGILVSQDPAGAQDQLLWHISVSHRQGWKHSGEEVYSRLPT